MKAGIEWRLLNCLPSCPRPNSTKRNSSSWSTLSAHRRTFSQSTRDKEGPPIQRKEGPRTSCLSETSHYNAPRVPSLTHIMLQLLRNPRAAEVQMNTRQAMKPMQAATRDPTPTKQPSMTNHVPTSKECHWQQQHAYTRHRQDA